MPINFLDSMCAKVSPSARKGEVSGWGHGAPYRVDAGPRIAAGASSSARRDEQARHRHSWRRPSTPGGGSLGRVKRMFWCWAGQACWDAVHDAAQRTGRSLQPPSGQGPGCSPCKKPRTHGLGLWAWWQRSGAASFDQGHFHPACLGIAAEDDGDSRLLQQDAGRRHAQFKQLLLHRQGALLGQLSVRGRIPRGIVKT